MSNINEKNLGPRWYVAHTFTGYENKVKISIEKIVENRHLEDLIYDVRIPVKKTIETNDKGEQKEVEVKLLPSYVLVKMTMTDESWHVVRNITGVTGFVGPGSEPTPLTPEEVSRFDIIDVTEESEKIKVGDTVSVISGVFEGYTGTVQEVKEDSRQVVVLVKTERREIPFISDIDAVRISK